MNHKDFHVTVLTSLLYVIGIGIVWRTITATIFMTKPIQIRNNFICVFWYQASHIRALHCREYSHPTTKFAKIKNKKIQPKFSKQMPNYGFESKSLWQQSRLFFFNFFRILLRLPSGFYYLLNCYRYCCCFVSWDRERERAWKRINLWFWTDG